MEAWLKSEQLCQRVNKPADFATGIARSENLICRRLGSRSHLAARDETASAFPQPCAGRPGNSVDHDYLYRRR
jgi:hypothetical protein